MPIFRPILAGATFRDRLQACFGGIAGIAATSIVCHTLLRFSVPLPLLVAPMGASAVLIFAIPASPLAQPWAVIGGNTISACAGVAAARLLSDPSLAAGLAVGLAIFAMSLLRCLHPPGGAAALTAVIGGPAVHAAGFSFALVPVGVNAAILVFAGWLFHRISGHTYPHRPALAAAHRPLPFTDRLHSDDIERALADMGDVLDVSPADLKHLFERAEAYAADRQRRGIGQI